MSRWPGTRQLSAEPQKRYAVNEFNRGGERERVTEVTASAGRNRDSKMLLEMALAEFSHERDSTVSSGSSGDSPVDSPSPQSYERGSRLEWLGHNVPHSSRRLHGSGDVEDPPQLCLQVGAFRRKARISRSPTSQEETESRKATLNRCQSAEQFYGEEAAVPFEWEDSPGKSRMVHESRSFGRSSHPEPLPLPPASRAIAIFSPRSVRTVVSPIKGVGGAGTSMLGAISPINVKESAALTESAISDFSSRGKGDVDRDLVDSSDDGEATSPVSTLDLPKSPITPSYSFRKGRETVTRPPQLGQEGVRRQGVKLNQARPMSHWTNTLMSEELPAVMEEDEEDLESMYGYHTMEFQTTGSSPSTSEDRRDSRMSGREASSKSWSGPNSRQNSSLRPTAVSRGRRRSDFDWPEDFEERPEEVVKEVDEALWAFSPVRSTFVYSGNDTADSGNNSHGAGVTETRTPPGSSPGLGSMLEHISFKKSLGRSASKTPPMKSPSKGEYPSQRSSRVKSYSVNGDDDYLSPEGHPMKRSYSCLPFFSLCSAQRPATISFSQRLGPTLSNLNNSSLGNLNH